MTATLEPDFPPTQVDVLYRELLVAVGAELTELEAEETRITEVNTNLRAAIEAGVDRLVSIQLRRDALTEYVTMMTAIDTTRLPQVEPAPAVPLVTSTPTPARESHPCPHCPRVLPTARGLATHMGQKHKDPDTQAAIDAAAQGGHEPDHVEASLTVVDEDPPLPATMLDDLSDLEPTVERDEQGEQIFKCEELICDRLFHTRTAIRFHVRDAHNRTATKSELGRA